MLAGPERRPLLIRGAGELASAVAWLLRRSGFQVAMTELASPLAVRRLAAFSSAVKHGVWEVEGVSARLCGPASGSSFGSDPDVEGREDGAAAAAARAEAVRDAWTAGDIAVVVDEGLSLCKSFEFPTIVDARMLKRCDVPLRGRAPLTIALGPGWRAGEDVDAVVETQRGHDLGRVIYNGKAAPNTGVPGVQEGRAAERVHKSLIAGRFEAEAEIGDLLAEGDLLGHVVGSDVDGLPERLPQRARFAGRLRGLIAHRSIVEAGTKLGDVDPRGAAIDPATISDKGRTIAAGVLMAVMAVQDVKTAPGGNTGPGE